MSLGPRYTCPTCDGFLSTRASYSGTRRCQCHLPSEERRAGGTFASWYLDEHPELRLTEDTQGDPMPRKDAA